MLVTNWRVASGRAHAAMGTVLHPGFTWFRAAPPVAHFQRPRVFSIEECPCESSPASRPRSALRITQAAWSLVDTAVAPPDATAQPPQRWPLCLAVDRAFAAMRPGCYMAKIDLKAFSRHVGVDPADWCFMGLCVLGWREVC